MAPINPSSWNGPSVSYQAPRRGFNWLPIAIGCSAGCGLLLILFVVALVPFIRHQVSSFGEADHTARQFLQYVQAGKPEQAYAMASPTLRGMSSLSDFKKYLAQWHQQQGDFKSISLKSNQFYSGTSGTTATLVYDVHGTLRDGQVLLVLVPEDKGMSVQTCNYNLSFTSHAK